MSDTYEVLDDEEFELASPTNALTNDRAEAEVLA